MTYYLLIIFAALGYALQNALLAKPFRTLDPFMVVSVRGLSLGITMLPFLLGAKISAFALVDDYAWDIVWASVIALGGNLLSGWAYRYWSMGVLFAVYASTTALLIVIIDIVFFDVRLTNSQYLVVLLILCGVGAMGWLKGSENKLIEENPVKGMSFILMASIFMALSVVYMGYLSRKVDPYIIAYAWETCIGLLSFIAFLVVKKIRQQPLNLNWKDSFQVAWRCSGTVIGTGFYAIALTLGPLSIAAAIMSTVMIHTAIFAWLIYREQLRRIQWLTIVYICIMVAILKVLSS